MHRKVLLLSSTYCVGTAPRGAILTGHIPCVDLLWLDPRGAMLAILAILTLAILTMEQLRALRRRPRAQPLLPGRMPRGLRRARRVGSF